MELMIEILVLLVDKKLIMIKHSIKNYFENKIYQTQSNVTMYTNQINTLEDDLRKHQSAQRVYEQNQKLLKDLNNYRN